MWNDQRRRTFQSWSDMKARCYNPKCHNYPNYGGRGITVCARWLESFKNFVDDLGLKPDGLTLERKNTNGNYEPDNCKWADRAEQRRNQRDCVILFANGEGKTPEEWGRVSGINPDTIRKRKRRGMSDHDAIFMPRANRGNMKAARSAPPAEQKAL